MAGAFVRLDGAADGFLPDSEGGAGVAEGQVLGVRVTRAAQGGKGPRLTARLMPAEAALVGAGPPALLRRGPGAVERLAALHPDAPVEVDDAAVVAALRPALGERLRLVRAAFDDAVAAAGRRRWPKPWRRCPAARRLSVHPTPALIAIDVDLGAATGARGGKARTQFAANRALLPALARQIRLRNLSGAILVDLGGHVGRPPRAGSGPDLRAALAADPLAPRSARLHRAGPGRDSAPARASAAARGAGGAACRRAGGAARGRRGVCRAARTACPRCAPPRRWRRRCSADPVALADWQRRTGRPFPCAPTRPCPAAPGAWTNEPAA